MKYYIMRDEKYQPTGVSAFASIDDIDRADWDIESQSDFDDFLSRLEILDLDPSLVPQNGHFGSNEAMFAAQTKEPKEQE